MIKTNKDFVFLIIVTLWLLVDAIILLISVNSADNILLNNLVFIALIGILVLVKYKNNKFNNWLEKKF